MKLVFLLIQLAALCYMISVDAMSIEKQIFSAAPDASMHEVFHLMPEGDVKVMSEFDLLLTMKQYNKMHSTSDGRSKRKAMRDINLRWKNCYVYYEIDDSLDDPRDKKVISDAMAHWSKYTCLQFIENKSKNNRIIFKNAGGCYSQLGMQSEPQPIGLARGCRTLGIVVHEIGHAIGFIHEHMRPDRDQYVKINFKAIPERFHANYALYSTNIVNTYEVPYDYLSVMHYGSSLIPNSLQTLDKSFQNKVGQRKGLTFKDIKLANLMYQCAKVMGCSKKDCGDNGFVFYKNFQNKGKCKCWCDSGKIDDPLVLCSENPPVIPSPKPEPTVAPPPMECMDLHADCKDFKEKGECMSNMEIMMDVCAKTCGFCGKGKGMCMDHEKSCKLVAAAGLCKNSGFEEAMTKLCPVSCNLCPTTPPDPCQIMEEMMGKDKASKVSADQNNKASVRQWQVGAVCLPLALAFYLTPKV